MSLSVEINVLAIFLRLKSQRYYVIARVDRYERKAACAFSRKLPTLGLHTSGLDVLLTGVVHIFDPFTESYAGYFTTSSTCLSVNQKPKHQLHDIIHEHTDGTSGSNSLVAAQTEDLESRSVTGPKVTLQLLIQSWIRYHSDSR